MEEVLHIVVGGRVQGVGFRFHTEMVAIRLGIAGWVRNLPTGEVEILARVPAGDKQRFLAAVRQGPAMARVEAMRVRPADDSLTCPAAGFTVRG
jgi:acylphosphatase